MTPIPATIEFQEVWKSYDHGSTWVTSGISFRVAEGELLILLGASGCGKTTTLKMVNRLVEPTRGTVRVNGRDVSGVDPVTLRRGIGYVFQSIGLFPHLTVAQNVAVVPNLLGWPKARTHNRVDELLELVGLPGAEYRNRYPRELSGGQKQRVGFARALAMGPSVMLLDEPFGALDPISRDTLQNEFARLRKKLNLTAMMVTHDMTEALLLADRIAVMNRGQILRIGTPHELMHDPGDPFVESLLQMPRHQLQQLEELHAHGGANAPSHNSAHAREATTSLP